MPGGDENFYTDEDYDDDIFEGVLMATCVAALATLFWVRARWQAQQAQGQGQAQGQVQGQGQAQGQVQDQEGGGQQNNGGNGDAQQAQQQEGQGDRGVFPARNDPNYMDWVAGGVGH